MIAYDIFCQIRQLRDTGHLTITQIAAQLGLHWQTVAKADPKGSILER